MLTYDLKARGSQPLYHYLYRCIRRDIESGRIATDEKLPSKRSLAEHLGISVLTVQNAYGQLISEGYLYSREKSGYYACKLDRRAAAPSPLPLSDSGAEPAPCRVDFTRNSVLSDRFPFASYAKITREILSEKDEKLFSPLPRNGLYELRRAIAGFLLQYKGVAVDPEQMVIGAGTEYLYTLLVQLLGREPVYAVEDPGYQTIGRIYHSMGVRCVPVPLDQKGLSVDALERQGGEIAHVSPTHHFPTGLIMPADRRRQLLSWAEARAERYIIEDDYDSEFRYVGKPIPPLLELDQAGKVIYMNTFSKTFSPSVRISYMILPPGLADRFREKLGFLSCTVSALEQFALARFLSTGLFIRHLNRSVRGYRLRRDAVRRCFQEAFGSGVDILEADSGLHFIARFRCDFSDAEIKNRFWAAGIRINCLSEYYVNKENAPRGRVIVNYSGVEPDALKEALQDVSLK